MKIFGGLGSVLKKCFVAGSAGFHFGSSRRNIVQRNGGDSGDLLELCEPDSSKPWVGRKHRYRIK